jgi:hypothetical protein
LRSLFRLRAAACAENEDPHLLESVSYRFEGVEITLLLLRARLTRPVPEHDQQYLFVNLEGQIRDVLFPHRSC